MEKRQIILLGLIVAIIFLLVYSPHFNYHLHYHIDEWHHITEAEKLKEGSYSGGSIGFRIGFHIILMAVSFFFNLLKIYEILL